MRSILIILIFLLNLFALENCSYEFEYKDGYSTKVQGTSVDYKARTSKLVTTPATTTVYDSGWKYNRYSYHFSDGEYSGSPIWNGRGIGNDGYTYHKGALAGQTGDNSVTYYYYIKRTKNVLTCPNGETLNGTSCNKTILECDTGYSATSGADAVNGECKKITITYHYNYHCSSDVSSQGFDWEVVDAGAVSTNVETPPTNNCRRKYQACDMDCEYGFKWDDGNKICHDPFYSNKDVIAITTDMGKCEEYRIKLGFEDIDNRVLYEDYDFAKLGISSTQFANTNYCIVAGDNIKGDNLFTSIENDKANESLYYTSPNEITSDECSNIAQCINGDVLTTYLGLETKECKIKVNDETGEDISDATIGDPNTQLVDVQVDEGSFLGKIDGVKDIYSVQEYTEGRFGYFSNYNMILPLNNIIKIDDREISPINQQIGVDRSLNYNFNIGQKTQTTKNKKPTAEAYYVSGLSLQANTDSDTSVGSVAGFLSSGNTESILGIATLGTSYVLGAVFGKKQKWGYYKNSYDIYETITANTKYVPNLYNYDTRYVDGNEIFYDKLTIHSGLRKKSDYNAFISSYKETKKAKMLFQGYSVATVENSMSESYETANRLGYPSIKWYKSSGRKTNGYTYQTGTNQITKDINTIYMGAVNSLSIVVPYAGDYEVEAYDKNGNILGTKIIHETSFVSNLNTSSGNISSSVAKIQFSTAENFNIADGLTNDNTTGGCIASGFVEWGGGVSGHYYEVNTPEGFDCSKSSDYYVKAHSATKLTVRALNSEKAMIIKLVKPMPFANRANLITLGGNETRKYSCFNSLDTPCQPFETGE